MKGRLAVLLLCAALAACTAGEFRPGPSATSYPSYRGEMQVLECLPQSDGYENLGVVIVTAGEFTQDDSLRARAVELAARQGANAVVWQGPIKLVPYEAGHLQKKLGAYAIRFKP